MSTFSWKESTAILKLREDEFSWQGAHVDDPMVFLRRLKDDDTQISDAQFGSRSTVEAKEIFLDFISETGGLGGNRLRILAVSNQGDGAEYEYRELATIVTHAVTQLIGIHPKFFLENRRGKRDLLVTFDD